MQGERSFWEVVIEVTSQWDHEARPMTASTLAEALSGPMGCQVSLAAAWMESCDIMSQYASADLEVADDVLDEELAAITASRQAFRPLLEARVQARIDRVDDSTKGQATCAQCGSKASSHGRPSRVWESTLGTLKLKRRWSICPNAEHRHGRSLAQEALMLPEAEYTALLDEAITLVATTVPHGMAVQLLGKIMGVEVSNHAVQNAVERRAERVVELQDQDATEQIAEEKVEELKTYFTNNRDRMEFLSILHTVLRGFASPVAPWKAQTIMSPARV